jgi:uncharacterized membrane protein
MPKGRLEAFSDGVVAIIITIMVLEMKVPEGEDLEAVLPLWPVFLSYILSFINIGIYWNNHHHMLHSVKQVTGGVLWSNLHLLFWLSLIPFATGWMGENHFARLPVAVYGFVLMMSGVAYFILVRAFVHGHGENSEFASRVGSDLKGKISVIIYALAIGLAFVESWVALALIAGVAAMWLIPDRRFERSAAVL